MTERRIDNPIINTPFAIPDRHFRFDDEGITEDIVEGRRPSAYFTAIPQSKRRAAAQQELALQEWTLDRLKESEFVNQLRERVDVWRQLGYPHVTGTTRRLLEYWTDPDRERKLFFAQVEALETLIFLHRPGREPLAHTPPRPIEGDELELRNLAEGLDIDDTTAMSLWDGTRVRADDLSWAILSVRTRQN